MKIIHTSDLHIDSALTTHLSHRKARERKAELAVNFDRLIERATNECARGIIIAGDLFDTEYPQRSAVERVMYSIKKASEISFYYLCGNHEKSALSESGIPLPENLFVFGEEWTYFKLGDVVIAGRSKTEENMFSTLRISERNTILVLHGELSDKSDSSGSISQSELANSGAKYIALGHYHSYSEIKLSGDTFAVYSGTPEGRGFDETGKKGYVTVKIENGAFSHEFTEFAKRSLHIIKIDVSDASKRYEIDDKITEATRHIPIRDLVRISLVGMRQPLLLDDLDGYITRHADRFYHLDITDDTSLRISTDELIGSGTVAGEFLRRVFADVTLSQEEKQRIIECGLSAMEINL